MQVEIYVQARMGSTRLPGKVLNHVLGKPLLLYLIERLRQSKEASNCVILTTTLPQDDVIVDFCKKHNQEYFRGDPEDVLDRYYQAAVLRKPDGIARITGDCPLIDPEIVDEIIKSFKKNSPKWDMVSNTVIRTYPRGLDTEVFSFKALKTTFEKAKNVNEREHVTYFMYRHPESFNILNISCNTNESRHRWTVDTAEDFDLIKLIIENLYPKNPEFHMRDVLSLLKKHPDWQKINKHVKQKTP